MANWSIQSFKVSCVIIVAIVLWASAFVGIRIGLTCYSPGALALLRFIVASMCMLIIYYSLGIKKRVVWRDRLQLLFSGIGGIGIYNICLNFGELSVSAGVASFILGLMPVLIVILSLIFLREKLARGTWFGIVISLLGLALLAIDNNSKPGMQEGILAILVSALMGAILVIIQKHFLTIYHPVAIIAWGMSGGTLLLSLFLPDMLQQIKTADFQITAAVIYMGIFPAALAYLAWAYVLKYLSASNASIMLYTLPIVSTLMGFLFLDEHPSLLSLIGCSITLLGAFIASRFQMSTSFGERERHCE